MIERRIHIIRADITKLQVDVIVNPANVSARCGNGVDRAIFEAAGKDELLLERKRNKPFMTRGEVFVTPSYNLRRNGVKYIFHTLSTFWINGKFKEEEILSDCYRNCLLKAHELHCKSIAFPILGSGSFQYPIEKAFEIAHKQCRDYDGEYGDMKIYLVVYRGVSVDYCEAYFRDIDSNDISDEDVEQGINKEYLIEDENFGSIVLPDFVKTTEEEASSSKNSRRYIAQADIDKLESSEAYMQVK